MSCIQPQACQIADPGRLTIYKPLPNCAIADTDNAPPIPRNDGLLYFTGTFGIGEIIWLSLKRKGDPIAHNEEELDRARESIDLIVGEVQCHPDKLTDWENAEVKELARAEFQIRRGIGIAKLKPSMERWLQIVRDRTLKNP